MKSEVRLAKAEIRLLLSRDEMLNHLEKEIRKVDKPYTRKYFEEQKEQLIKRTKRTNHALKRLSKKQRVLIDMVFFNPPNYLTDRKISKAVNIPVEAVEDYKREALSNLYLLLQGCRS